MSKRGFVRGARRLPPTVPPRVAVAAIGAAGARATQHPANDRAAGAVGGDHRHLGRDVHVRSAVAAVGLFSDDGSRGFGALMFSGSFGWGRRISWGEQEKQRRVYLRQLDEDREEVQRAAQDHRRSQLFVHGDPQNLDNVIGGPRMWERRAGHADFLDVRLGIGVQQASDSAVSLQWPEVPIGEELEPVTGGALRDFILEQSKIRGIGKVLPGRSPDSVSSPMIPPSCTALRGRSCVLWRSITVRTTSRSWWSRAILSCGRGWCGCRTISTMKCSTPAACGGSYLFRPPS